VRRRIDELLPILGLDGEETKLTMEYSHGMKKKLALAAALLPNPDLLFLDEPFEGVDAVTSHVIRDLLAGFVARGRRSFSRRTYWKSSRNSARTRASSLRGGWSNNRPSTRSGKGVLWRPVFSKRRARTPMRTRS